MTPFSVVDVAPLAAWLTCIPFEEWPQQNRPTAQLRPAMVTDLSWHRFGEMTDPVVAQLLPLLPGRVTFNRMLSVVMPAAGIDAHRDAQPAHWLTRVHVPIVTSERAWLVIEGVPFNLKRGSAYFIDTRLTHEIRNEGTTSRIHFMFDVGR